MSRGFHRDFMLANDNSSSMGWVSDYVRCWSRLLMLLLMAGSVLAFPSGASAGRDGSGDGGGNGNGQGNGNGRGRRDPAQFSGTFLIFVRGFFTSDPSNSSANTASVTSTSVSLHARLKDDAGNSYTLDASNLRITDNYHFSGTGTIGGTQVTIDGHVDPSDPTDSTGNGRGQGHGHQVVSQTRLECTYTTNSDRANERHSGRIVGTRQGSGP
jgi:hypothetical protein